MMFPVAAKRSFRGSVAAVKRDRSNGVEARGATENCSPPVGNLSQSSTADCKNHGESFLPRYSYAPAAAEPVTECCVYQKR